MKCTGLLTAILGLVAITGGPSLGAQEIGVRLGAGAAVAGEFGVAGLLGVHLRTDALMIRADARVVSTSEGAGARSGSKVLSAGIAAGWTSQRATPALRPYALATFGLGIDLREADRVTTLGAALGLDRLLWRYLFGEVRYEHWIQNGVEYYDLPRHTVSLVLGFGLP